MLHGILGSSRNWISFSSRWAERCPDWRVVLVDLRNHGESRGRPAPHDLEAVAGDVVELATQIGFPEVLVGHSFGGKVAASYARRTDVSLETAWILDCPLGSWDSSDPVPLDFSRMISALGSIPQPLSRRTLATELLCDRGFSSEVAGWMSTNLEKEGDGYRWTFDLAEIPEMLTHFWESDLWPAVEEACSRVKFRLVRAEDNDRWPPEELDRMERLGSSVTSEVLPNAGHWLHVDNAGGLLDMMSPPTG